MHSLASTPNSGLPTLARKVGNEFPKPQQENGAGKKGAEGNSRSRVLVPLLFELRAHECQASFAQSHSCIQLYYKEKGRSDKKTTGKENICRYSSLACHGNCSYLFFFLSADQERWIVFCFLCRQEMQMKRFACWSNACCIVPLWIKGLHVCCGEAAGETGFCRTACRLRKQVSLSFFFLAAVSEHVFH